MFSYGFLAHPLTKTEWPSTTKYPCFIPNFYVYCSIPGTNRTIFTSVKITEMGNAPEEGISFKCTVEIVWYRDITDFDSYSNI